MIQLKFIVKTVILFLIFTSVFADTDGDHKKDSDINHREDNGSVILEHIHSLDFYDNAPLTATHHGLIYYNQGEWEQINSPEHDYMGFSLTENGFYASGHPDPTTTIEDPLGIVWSDDLGKHLKPVAYYGELDFHWLTAGFNTDYLYTYTSDYTESTPAGLYYSSDKGRTWRKPLLNGVSGKMITFKAHPQIDGAVFMSTTLGIFLSLDNGNNFFLMLKDLEGGALTVTTDGKYLFSGTSKLTRLDISGKKQTGISIPGLGQNEILTDIAVSATDINQIVINTNNLNMYITYTGGNNWEQILFDGNYIH